MSKQIFTIEIDSGNSRTISDKGIYYYLTSAHMLDGQDWEIKVTEEKKLKYKPHSFPISIETGVFIRQNKKCCNCGKDLDLKYDRPDHIIPQTKMNIRIYGEDLIQSQENCQIPCEHCHTNKALWSKDKQSELRKKWEPFSKSKLRKIQ